VLVGSSIVNFGAEFTRRVLSPLLSIVASPARTWFGIKGVTIVARVPAELLQINAPCSSRPFALLGGFFCSATQADDEYVHINREAAFPLDQTAI
jgi:hypothetical protein